ncbi:membrane-anchored junction protein isoform X2 [Clupea harengus]|uniref:Membrane-anchored junction protein isoform X2 n=1 Tax=Clupea harengus TaxID=7950 RepID=A0A6P3VPC2_CLUHA|nr:membrane-anchored junction protein isoform X2 [Clupea harengus]
MQLLKRAGRREVENDLRTLMPVQAFSFPVPETRFFQAGRRIFKFKITRGGNYSGEDMTYDDFVNEELEDAIRIVLASLDTLQPFATKHFNVIPYKCRWERVSKLRFELNSIKLSPYPYLITLYVEPRLHSHGHTGKKTGDWDVTDSKQDASPCPSSPCRPRKHSKKEQPPESALLQPSTDPHNQQSCHQDSPERADEAEEIVYDSKVNAGLEECLNSTQDEQRPEGLPRGSVEQTAPDVSEQKSPEEDNPNLVTRLARAVFPLSLFFKK